MSERGNDRIGDEATRWFVLMQDAEPGEEQRRACADWLAADPRHAAAWRDLEAMWHGLEALPRAARRTDETASRRSVLLRGLAGLAAGGALLTGAGALSLWGTPGAAAAVRTAPGERRRLNLEDGTAVEMNGDSALTPLAGGAALFRGEAYFTVPGDFRVQARDGTLAGLRGAFNVKLAGRTVVATLAEGTLSIALPGGQPLSLAPGESASYGPLGATPPQAAKLAQVLAWREGRLIFEDAPLGEVLAELQRHHAARLLLSDEQTGRLRVTAVFDLVRIDAALDTLATILPLRIRRIGGLAVVIEPAG